MLTGLLKSSGVFLFPCLLLILWANNATLQASAANPPDPTVEVTPVPTVAGATPVPTVDRLAAPPTVENPTQADEGAQLYWLNCQPCHGDRGQGLTDEWRAQYPPEDQNCWESGCHGERPYERGFTLPTRVPPVVGPGSLERFQTAGQVVAYIQSAMPYQAPGSLSQEEYLAITAFLAREHGVWDGRPLRTETVDRLRFQPEDDGPSETPPADSAGSSPVGPPRDYRLAGIVILVVPVLLLGVWLWGRRRRS